VLWNAIKNVNGKPSVFVMDLMRPVTESKVDSLTERYAEGEPEVLRRDFHNSLKAAFTPDEVIQQLLDSNLEGFSVSVVSDRHLVVNN